MLKSRKILRTGAALVSLVGLGALVFISFSPFAEQDLVSRLQIDVLTIFTDPKSEAHFIVVTGLSVDPSLEEGIVVHYNDPLTSLRDSALWAGPTGVWNAWQNNGDPGGPGWWLAIPPQ